jgi:hypothetical protein
MRRQSGTFVVVLTATVLFGAFIALCPAAAASDVFPMEADYPHTKPIVMFTHEAHIDDYMEKNPDLFADGCGACHHDDSGTPITDLTMDDDVNACFDCHDKPGRPDKDVKKQWLKEKLTREEKTSRELEYHAEALHANCIGCHRAFKKKTKSKAAPTSCSKCHKRSKK